MAYRLHTAPARAGERPHAQNLLVVAGESLTAALIIAGGGVFAYGFLPFA